MRIQVTNFSTEKIATRVTSPRKPNQLFQNIAVKLRKIFFCYLKLENRRGKTTRNI